jgi:hypothetical protein
LGERRTCTAEAVGSNPTISIRDLTYLVSSLFSAEVALLRNVLRSLTIEY